MRRYFALLASLFCAAPLHGQPPAAPVEEPLFRTETAVVEVSAVVVDEAGSSVLDLRPSDFQVLEDGEAREIVSFRQLVSAAATDEAHAFFDIPDARTEVVVSNTEHRDSPVFVLLLDDLNTSPFNAHRAIRGALGVLAALPEDALVAVLTTSGIDGTALTLTRRSAEHVARIKAFRGQLLLAGPGQKPFTPQTTPSAVAAPCGVGSGVLQPQDCADPGRAERRARVLQAVGDALRLSGSRRKVVFWVTEDMGVSPIAPEGSRAAQRDALRSVLGADVAVYPVNPIGNMAHAPGADDEDPGDGRPDRRTGASIAVGPGQFLATDSDDLVAVTLYALARDTGGRWIRQIDQLDEELATVVRQNSTAYLLAYASPSTRLPGRHRIEVRVTRPGTRVYARRGYIVPDERSPVSATPGGAPGTTTLADLLQRVVPQGELDIRLLVTPFLADGRDGLAYATVRVDPSSAPGQDVALALVTVDAEGLVANQRTLRFAMEDTGVPWEATEELSLSRGTHQLRVAAVTLDGTRHGLVVERIVIAESGRDLYLGQPMVLTATGAADAAMLHPTLQREFDVGHPLAVQCEMAGRALGERDASLTMHLATADGTVVREGTSVLEPDVKHKDRARATAVVSTDGVAPGRYALVIEARSSRRDEVQRHAVPLLLRARSDTSRTTAIVPHPVAHGPTSLFRRGGTHVIRTPEAWQQFWQQLPTRLPPVDIDFDRVVLLAVVLDDNAGQLPEVMGAGIEGGELVLRWRAASAEPSTPLRRPFVVVGVMGYSGSVRFEQVHVATVP